jgi:hypothetical protein
MIAFLPINKHPTTKGEAIDMDRFVNYQNLDRFAGLCSAQRLSEKFCWARKNSKFIEYRR